MRRALGRRLLGLMAISAVLAVAVSACGSSSTKTSAATSVASAGTPGSTTTAKTGVKPVVHVFGLGVETSPALGALFPAFTEATTEPNVAAKAIDASASSKVKVDYTFCDTKAEASGTVACAKQAASPTACDGNPCDVAIQVGDPNDDLSAPLLSKEGIPTVNVDVGTTQAASSPGEFCINSGGATTYSGLGYVMKKEGATKVGVMSVDRPDAQQDQDNIVNAAKAQGLEVTGQQIIPQSTVSPNATIESVMTGGANGLIDAVVGPVGAAFQYAKQTYPGVHLAIPLIEVAKSFFAGVPSSVLNGVGVSAVSEPSSASTIPGIKMWKAEGGLKATTPAWRHFDFSVLEWLAMHFIANVADTNTSKISPASMMAAFKAAHNINMYGIVPPFNASQMGKDGALPCSPYNVIVADTLHNDGVQYADNPGVFVNAKTGATEYVDPGFKK